MMCPLQLRWTMVTSWSWMVQRNRSMHIARCLGCGVLGFTLHIDGSHITLRPVHLKAVGCVLPSCVQGSAEPSSRCLGVGENNRILFGIRSSFCQSLCFSFWSTLGFTIGRCTSFCGSCPLGWGTALATVTTLPFSKEEVFLFLL